MSEIVSVDGDNDSDYDFSDTDETKEAIPHTVMNKAKLPETPMHLKNPMVQQ